MLRLSAFLMTKELSRTELSFDSTLSRTELSFDSMLSRTELSFDSTLSRTELSFDSTLSQKSLALTQRYPGQSSALTQRYPGQSSAFTQRNHGQSLAWPKGSLSRYFFTSSCSWFEPIWAPDKRAKVFSNFVSISPRYSIPKLSPRQLTLLGVLPASILSILQASPGLEREY